MIKVTFLFVRLGLAYGHSLSCHQPSRFCSPPKLDLSASDPRFYVDAPWLHLQDRWIPTTSTLGIPFHQAKILVIGRFGSQRKSTGYSVVWVCGDRLFVPWGMSLSSFLLLPQLNFLRSNNWSVTTVRIMVALPPMIWIWICGVSWSSKWGLRLLKVRGLEGSKDSSQSFKSSSPARNSFWQKGFSLS